MKPLYEAIGELLIERGWIRLKHVSDDAHGEKREWQAPPLTDEQRAKIGHFREGVTPAMTLWRAIDYEMDRELLDGK